MVCHTEKDTKAWHRQGKEKHNKTKNVYNLPKLPANPSSCRSASPCIGDVIRKGKQQVSCRADLSSFLPEIALELFPPSTLDVLP